MKQISRDIRVSLYAGLAKILSRFNDFLENRYFYFLFSGNSFSFCVVDGIEIFYSLDSKHKFGSSFAHPINSANFEFL